MDEKEFKALVDKLGKETAAKIKSQFDELETSVKIKVDAAVEKGMAGLAKQDDVKAEVAEALKEYGTKATDLEAVVKAQGDKINGLIEKQSKPFTGMKMIEDIFTENIPKLKELHAKGTGFIEVSLKAAVVDSIANSIQNMTSPPGSPYAPGISNIPLTVYDIIRNPNFVSNYVDTGTTDVSRLAWINETALTGLPALVLEGAQKPQESRTFQVEFSQAKKIAAYLQITEEFDQDLSYLTSQVKSLLQQDLVRAYDSQIQADVIAAATPFNFTDVGISGYSLSSLQNGIYDATYWDGLAVMGAYPRNNNFIPNVSLINPLTWIKMQTTKDTVGRYNFPADSLQESINPIHGNKLFPDYAIVGDLKQFKVLIYKDFVLKMGWINDDFIRNQFTVVAEVRFHDYISAARKKAIVYGDCKWVAEQANSNSQPITGS